MIEDNNQNYLHIIRQDCPVPPGTHAVIYCRDSGGEEQDRSISQQVAVAREYCEHHKLIVDEVYIDEARVSSNTTKRDALQNMLIELRHERKTINDRHRREKVATEKPYAVIFWKSNRLGRDSVEATNIKTDLRLRGITIIDLITAANTGNAAVDSLIEAIQLWKDEQDLAEISQNARRGLTQLVSTRDDDPEFLRYNPEFESTGGYLGLSPAKPPPGYKGERVQIGVYKRKKGRNTGEKRVVQRFVPDPETWDMAYLAWKMRHEGRSYQDIHRETRLYKSINSYNNFFSNRLYTGDYEYGGKLYENFVPAMIPREWFEAEQQRRLDNQRRTEARRKKKASEDKPAKKDPMREPRRVGFGYLLSGLVFCGHVDGEEHAMNIETIPPKKGKRGKYSYFICNVMKNSRKLSCEAGRVSRPALEQAVVDNLLEHVLTVENLRPLIKELTEALNTRSAEAETQITMLKNQLENTRKALANILDALETMGYSKMLKQRYDERRFEEAELSSQLEAFLAIQAAPIQVKLVDDEMLENWVAYLRDVIANNRDERARKLMQAFIAKIVIKDGMGTLYYTFPFPDEAYMPSLRRLDLRRPHSNKLDAVEILKSA